ncbi:energy-coupling factor transporter transmembrane component T family protein, partial [Aminipila sp.]
MIRDITLGQYYPGHSCIHQLDPRIKIIGTFIYIVALFVVSDFIGFAVAAAALAIIIGLSRVPFRFIAKGLKPVFLIIAFTFLINMFMTDGRTLYHIGF